MLRRQIPRDRPAPVMRDDNGLGVGAVMIDQPEKIADKMLWPIILCLGRFRRQIETAQVRRDSEMVAAELGQLRRPCA